jgi:hypothetical protein
VYVFAINAAAAAAAVYFAATADGSCEPVWEITNSDQSSTKHWGMSEVVSGDSDHAFL